MKKVITISILVLYSVFSIGLVIYSRYCDSSLYETSLLRKDKNCCNAAQDDKSCCETVTSTIKIDHSYDFTSNLLRLEIGLAPIIHGIAIPEYFFQVQDFLGFISGEHKFYHLGKLPIYLIKQAFII